MNRRRALRVVLLAIAAIFVYLLPETAEAKKKKGGGKRNRGRGGRGKGRRGRGRSSIRRYTAKHTGVFKRIGDPDWCEKRHELIRQQHQAAMQALRSNGTL